MRIGKIYKVVTGQSDVCYVGSTFNELKYRFRNHKSDFKAWMNGTFHEVSIFKMFKNHGVENCKILLVKKYEVCDREHLEAYETLWINRLNSINKYEPFQIKKLYMIKWRTENNEHIKLYQREYGKKYREENKEEISRKKKEYYEQNKAEISKYKLEYREKNKAHIAEQKKKYREENRDKIAEKKKEKIKCTVCECEIRKDGIKEHERTKKHLKNAKGK